MPTSAVLNDFTPLNVIVGEQGIGMCDYARMNSRGISYHDAAPLLGFGGSAWRNIPSAIGPLRPRCSRRFADGYGITPAEQGMMRVLKMKALLGMFAQGTAAWKDSAVAQEGDVGPR